MFYALEELRDDLFVLPDPVWHRDAEGLFCRECGRVARSVYPQPIDARLGQLPADTTVSGVFPLGFGVAHVELLRVLRPHMGGFVFGQCLDQHGDIIPNYETYYSSDLVVERTERGEYHECPDCGSIRTAGTEATFLTEDVIEGRRVLQPYTTRLLISEELIPLIDRRRLPRFKLVPYPVRPSLRPGYLSPYEEATALLKAEFNGDLRAAHAAVEEEARRIRVPDTHSLAIGIVVRGIELILTGWAECGMMRISSMRVPREGWPMSAPGVGNEGVPAPEGDCAAYHAELCDARVAALAAVLGSPDDEVQHVVIPFCFPGSNADVLSFRHHRPGRVWATCDLLGDPNQQRSALGTYELLIAQRDDGCWGANLLARMARYTHEAVLNPGETMNIGPALPTGSTITGLLFCAYKQFTFQGEDAGLLLCLGLTADELEACQHGAAKQILAALRDKGVYPYTELRRTSVL